MKDYCVAIAVGAAVVLAGCTAGVPQTPVASTPAGTTVGEGGAAAAAKSYPLAFNAAGSTLGCWYFYTPDRTYLFAVAFPPGHGRKLRGGESLMDDYLHGPFEIEFDSRFHGVAYDAGKHSVSIDGATYDLKAGTVLFMQPNPADLAHPHVDQVVVPIDQGVFHDPSFKGGGMYVVKQLEQYLPAHAMPSAVAPAAIGIEIQKLQSPTAAECAAAVDALVKIGKPAMPALIETLGCWHDDVRARAAEAIRRILAADAAAAPNAHPKGVWEKRIAAIKPGMKIEDALALLHDDLSPTERQMELSTPPGLPRSATHTHRLDDYWSVAMFLEGPGVDKLSNRAPVLLEDVRAVAAPISTNYSGACTQWYVNGEKMNEAHYLDGKFHGRHVDYAFDGTKRDDFGFDHGAMDGPITSYFASGRVASEGHYDHGKSSGAWRRWYADGKPRSAFAYKDGELDGDWTQWYANGQKEEERHYQEGKQDGGDSHWDEAGKVLWVHRYKDGAMIDSK